MADKRNISIFTLFLSLLIPFTSSAQFKGSNDVVGTVGKDKITFSELENSYTQGNVSDYTLSDLESYLPLYLDYKAKLKFAKDQGYFSDSSLVAEHTLYSKQAAYAYWLNNEIRPTLFNAYYERALYELKSFHVLIAVPKGATPEDIDEIKSKLQQARNDIRNGMDLEEVDKKYSTFQGGRSMGGDLPWVSAGRFVKDFEDQVYELEIGEISEPFRTQFGYHIVLLQDKRERTPAKLLSHIYVRATQDSAAAIKIQNAYNMLETGEDWMQVVLKFTEDGASAPNGGNIGWVSSHSNYAPSFLDQIRQLDDSQEYSEPIRTNYGHHIFRVDSVQTFESQEHRKKELMKEFEKSNYFQESNEFAVQYLQDKYGSGPDEKIYDEYRQFISSQDSTKINELSIPSSLSSKKLFTFNNKEYSVDDLHAYVIRLHGTANANTLNDQWLKDHMQYVVDNEVIDLTLQTYPEFSSQIESYLNGLVVYKLNDDYVWSAETVDSTRLHSIYEKNAEVYSYPERPYFYMVSAREDSFLTKAKDFVNQGNSPDSIRAHINRVSVISDSLSTFQEEPYNRLQNLKKNTFSEVFEFNKRKAMFYLVDRLPARRMTFEEAFNRLLTEFQPEREREWMEKLRKQYKVKANPEKLRKIYQSKAQK